MPTAASDLRVLEKTAIRRLAFTLPSFSSPANHVIGPVILTIFIANIVCFKPIYAQEQRLARGFAGQPTVPVPTESGSLGPAAARRRPRNG